MTSALLNPSLQLVDAAGQVVATNDDWMTGSQAQEIIDAHLAPNDSRESAIIASLAAGAYTAVVTGIEGTQNISLVEVYDLDAAQTPQLLNISTRGAIDSGEGVMIAGTIIGGSLPETLLFRGLGPSLAAGIGNPLPNPQLQLIDGQGSTIFVNDDWSDTQASEIGLTGLAPTDALESAVLITLPAGNYTALMSDPESESGIGLAGNLQPHFQPGADPALKKKRPSTSPGPKQHHPFTGSTRDDGCAVRDSQRKAKQ